MDIDIEKIINEYPEDYCRFLELTYGAGMMSEGGELAVDELFSHETTLTNKNILDIGSGVGGAAIHLANKYSANLYGLEINPWMIQEATKRIPNKLKDKVTFSGYQPDSTLPYSDCFFDIVYSKGVLTHLENKDELFNEAHRVLKPQGILIINDWLSPTTGQWGECLQKMCDTEDLTLFAVTEESYQHLLSSHGFTSIQTRNENSKYHQYNVDVITHLSSNRKVLARNRVFNNMSLDDAIDCYQLIADSIKNNELLIRWFRGIKS